MFKQKSNPPITEADRLFFHGFYEEYKDFIFYIANRYVSNPHDCEDIVQESVIRLLQNISTLKELNHYKIAKYIVLTVRSAYIDCEARKSNASTITLEDYLEEHLSLEAHSQKAPPELQYYMEIQQLKSELSPRDWAILEGRYILGYTHEELAKKLNVSPESIRMILYRAKEKSRKILGRNSFDGGEL